jgi:hypothetical protein
LATYTLTKTKAVNKEITSQEVTVEGYGYVVWPMEDVNGTLRSIKVLCIFVPKVPQRLLSSTSLLQTYSDEFYQKDGKIGSIEAHVDPINNLPTTLMYVCDETNQAVKDFANMTTTVSEANHNLSDPEKELLKWHQRLGHISFSKSGFYFVLVYWPMVTSAYSCILLRAKF